MGLVRQLSTGLVAPWLTRAVVIGIGLGVYTAFNLYFIQHREWAVGVESDWWQYQALPAAMARGDLYNRELYPNLPWIWSPLFAPIMVGVTALGYWAFVAIKFVALAFLWRMPWLIVLALLSYAFWADALAVNVFTFVFVSAALALTGNRPAAYAYFALCLFLPRPVQIPVALYLLWTMPDLRRPVLVGSIIYGVGILASGYAIEWPAAMLNRIGDHPEFFGPTLLFGTAWLLIGVPLAAWLTRRGYPGTAGWVATPYMIETYWLMPLLDLLPRRIRLTRPR